ncbi:MAG: DUF5665 domain-containing protein [Patescibacteria group bacterium]|nr:DUF5665 domain-containing protein [Patescibacteria group bacterium]
MIDPELKTQLEKIDNHLVGIFHKTESLWRAFVRGMLQGIGSIVGIALAIFFIGWLLNVMGIIPGIREQAREWQSMWKQTLEQVQKVR